MAFPEEQAPLLVQSALPDLWAWRRRAPAVYLRSWFVREVAFTLSDRVTFAQSLQALGPAVLSGVPNECPVSFARAPSGEVYIATGLSPLSKWDGVRYASEEVGVPAPTETVTLAFSGTGVISGLYVAYQRWLDRDGNPSNLSPASQAVTADEDGTVTYTNVEAPTEPKITRRQILRNTAGQGLTFYVDVDTDDLNATTFTSTRTDVTLSVRTAVPLFDERGNSLANRFAIPRNDKPLIVSYLDRMFAAGEAVYGRGHIEVTQGSTTVTGVGTAWTASMAGRFLYGVGAGRPYEIASADAVAQTLTLEETWKGATDKFLVYSIRSSPAERRSLYFSEAGQYEAWPEFNGITVEENGDEITGLMVADSFLYVLQRRHIYRLSYHQGPLADGGLFLSARRGCVNNRCWVHFDGFAYLLDEQGIYRFDGVGETEALSPPIQDLFWYDRSSGGLRINWKAKKWFHALLSKDESCVRWFVALAGQRLPRHALAYNYLAETWWIEEYPFPVGASAISEGDLPRPLLAGPARRVLAQGVGTLDGPDPAAGTTRGTATSAGQLSLVDALASFPASGLVGSPVAIVEGRGKGQRNPIASVSGTTIRFVQPWLVQPDSTSVYQLGGVSWRWRSGLLRWNDEENEQHRRLEVIFKPCASDAQMDLRLFRDHASAADAYGRTWPVTPAGRDGSRQAKDSSDAIVDLTQVQGYAQIGLAARRARTVGRADVVAVELAGVSAENPITVYEVNVEGAR